jgi:putative transposase
MFNLPSPTGFRGLHPDLPIEMYSRNLPHWRQEGATYFVTFHLADALPLSKKKELESLRRDLEAKHPIPRNEKAWTVYANEIFRLVEKWMDAGSGECWFSQPVFAKELERAILHYNSIRYDVGCFVIMANHCHLVIRPFSGVSLENELGSIKSTVSRFINQQTHANGNLWEQESYDRIIRDEEHLYRVVQYIGSNPRLASVPRQDWVRWIDAGWGSLGWGFVDQ